MATGKTVEGSQEIHADDTSERHKALIARVQTLKEEMRGCGGGKYCMTYVER